MRILLVTWTDQLLPVLQNLNPELEYCAIVVDEVEPAKKILEQVGLSEGLLRPLYELKECCNGFYYDYILCVETDYYRSKITNVIQGCDVPKNKILNFAAFHSSLNFQVKNVLNYYEKHASEFEMFATGISYIQDGLDVTKFKRKLFNFAKGSQDLYYDFKVAKFAVKCAKKTGQLCYALIGLAPYSFHYDLSKTFGYRYILLQYLMAFDDLHNFFIPLDVYKKFLSREYLGKEISLETLNVNSPYNIRNPNIQFMSQETRLNARKVIDEWAEKNYPETRSENIKILDDYLTFCEENFIRPIMFLPPMTEGYIKYFNRQKIDEFYYLVNEACKKHSSAIFINGWKLKGITDSDFFDVFHLNNFGAAKFSLILNEVIELLDAKKY